MIFPTFVARIDTNIGVWDNKIHMKLMSKNATSSGELPANELLSQLNSLSQEFIKNNAGLYTNNSLKINNIKGMNNKTIDKDDLSKLISFFSKDIIPFLNSLILYSHQLDTTLDFDSHNIYSSVKYSSEQLSLKGDQLISVIPKYLHTFIKESFRRLLWPLIRQSYFVERGLSKPRGYPGDYVIVEEMYNGNPKSLGLGYIYDLIFLDTQLCRGLRNRKDQMKQIINNYLISIKHNNLNILNIACGGSRELRELMDMKLGLFNNTSSISLLDNDKNAIDFSIKKLSVFNKTVKYIPININVLDLLKGNPSDLLKYDLIYSIGLFDYLPDLILSKLIKVIINLLSRDGVFIFAHKDYTLYDPCIADWFCDWKYYHRSEKDLKDILQGCGVNNSDIRISREKDGYIFFMLIANKGLINK